jgi:hypothetical protein
MQELRVAVSTVDSKSAKDGLTISFFFLYLYVEVNSKSLDELVSQPMPFSLKLYKHVITL